MRMGYIVAALAAYLAGCTASNRDAAYATTRPASAAPSVLVTLSGARSHISELTYLRVTTKEAFQSLYLRHLGEDPAQFDAHHNVHEVPTIDFDRCMVVAVFRGNAWNTANLYVRELREEPTQLVVRFDAHSYQTLGFGSDGGANRVTPFGFFVMPLSKKELVIEEDVRQYLNEGPRWQERARLPAM